MGGPGGSGNIGWSIMYRGMGEHGEDNRFQSGIRIAIMLWGDDRDRLHPLAKELHEQWVFGATATDNDFVDGRMWKNKSLVVEGDRLNGERRAGASDVR